MNAYNIIYIISSILFATSVVHVAEAFDNPKKFSFRDALIIIMEFLFILTERGVIA